MKLLGDNYRKMNIFLCEDNKEHLSCLRETITTVAETMEWNIFLMEYESAEDKYTIFHTENSYYFDKISMKECETLLEPYGFYRIHRKYMVNMRYHKKLGKGKLEVSGEIQLPVSRSRQLPYEQCFMDMLEKGLLDR